MIGFEFIMGLMAVALLTHRGPAPPRQTPGFLGGYQDKYFGKSASGMRK